MGQDTDAAIALNIVLLWLRDEFAAFDNRNTALMKWEALIYAEMYTIRST
jgi:hypothetical protein